MDIDRNVYQGGLGEAKMRVKFCLDKLEKIEETEDNDIVTKIFEKRIGERLTVEEMIGALVSAEQEINNFCKGCKNEC